MFNTKSKKVISMKTRKKLKRKTSLKNNACVCGSCEYPNPHLPGYLIMALGMMFLPISFGFMPEFDWIAKGWPILVVLFGMVLVAKASVCSSQ
jgi:hypothetical protein